MIVTSYNKQRIRVLHLPQKAEGKYDIKDLNLYGKSHKLAHMEAVNGQWLIKCMPQVLIRDKQGTCREKALQIDETLRLYVGNDEEPILLYAQEEHLGYQVYRKYQVPQQIAITIGRAPGNIISYDSPYVSGVHAVLKHADGIWTIEDKESLNGLFVNNIKVTEKRLNPGDCIYIMGLKIIIGNGFFACNTPQNKVFIAEEKFSILQLEPIYTRQPVILEEEEDYFTIAPRFWDRIEEAHLEVDMPPALQEVNQVPIAIAIGPTLTMGLASLSTGALSVYVAISSGNSILTAVPMLVMSVSMLTGAGLWPVINRKYERKKKKTSEKERQEGYLKYLNDVREAVKRIAAEQKEILGKNVIDTEDCIYRIVKLAENMWERLAKQEDFLSLCVGRGDIPLQLSIKYPDDKFTLQKDALKDALKILRNEEKKLYNVPMAFSLLEHNRLGLIGERVDTINFLLALLTQVIALHSYQEVKLMFLVDEEEKEWQMFRWMPHTWDTRKTQRFYYSNASDIKTFDEFWKKAEGSMPEHAHYIVIAADRELAELSTAFEGILTNHELRLSVITLFDELKYTPKEIESLIEIKGDAGRLYHRAENNTSYVEFKRERYAYEATESIVEHQANCFLKDAATESKLPDMVTFLEMYEVNKVEHLNVLERWKQNDPVRSLKAPVGVNEKQELFYMDLHEKYHGPHGLIAGMTGSGKSEFIITFVLSLAVNYHPDEVSFILIDYKGGGLAGAFEDEEKGKVLPHLAGTITNLDGASVKRALISIQSELRRRQRVFNEARKIADEGTMDIYKYQELYRNHIVEEPMPHLMIVSDEFAELKSQQPEFMDQLISAARIGRSLGVHLILATQKPSGVVNDQIWSNSKFKVCLKVQDRADSMEVIKREDAAALVQTGRFYLQVGYNEYFALGQSAWCGADYVEREENAVVLREEISIIDNLGHVVKEIRPRTSQEQRALRRKEVVEIVEYLCNTARREHVQAQKLWLAPIPEYIYIDELKEKYKIENGSREGLEFLIGEYDDPANQQQHPLIFSFTKNGNTAVYGTAEAGKDIFLMTSIYQLLNGYSSKELLLFVLDFGSENMKVIEDAPQVGGVIYSAEAERINWLFRFLTTEIDRRKKAFGQYGGDYEAYRASVGENNEYLYIVLILSEYIGFRESYEDMEMTLITILRECVRYGIYVLVTASSTADIRYKMQQQIGQTIAMQLNDKSEYTLILGKYEKVYPSPFKGRGLIQDDGLYEFQTAYCTKGNVMDFMQEFCQNFKSDNAVNSAKVPYLPKEVTLENLRYAGRKPYLLPLGYCSTDISLCGMRLDKDFVMPVVAQEIGKLKPFLQELITVSVYYGYETYVLDAERLLDADGIYYKEEFEEHIVTLFNEVRDRNNAYAASHDKTIFSDKSEQVHIIVGLQKIFSYLSEDGKDKLEVLLRFGKGFYKVHVFIAERDLGLQKEMNSEWYQVNVYGQGGMWIGQGFERQKLFDVNTYGMSWEEESPYSYGYFVSGGRYMRARFLYKEGMEDE